jgi:hypothetical protein
MRFLVLPGGGIGPAIADVRRDRAVPARLIPASATLLERLGLPQGRGALSGAGQGIRSAMHRLLAERGGRGADPCPAPGARALGQAVAAALG